MLYCKQIGHLFFEDSMKRIVFLLISILILAALPAYAQTADTEDCQSEIPVDDYSVVVEACTALLEQDPVNVDAYFSRAYAQNVLGNYEEAIVDYSKVVFISPKYTAAFNNRGYAYARLGMNEEAVADYTRALSIDPTYTLALLNRAYAYMDAGDYENALADAELYAEQFPNSADIYVLRANIYIEQGQFEEALDAYDRYVDLAPNDPSAYLGRGFVNWSLGETDIAAADYMVWINRTAPDSETIDPDDAVEPFSLTFEEGIHYTLTLEAEAGDMLRASAVGRQETIDPVLVLLDPSGRPITMDDDSGGGLGEVDATIADFELPEDGEYTLIIGYAGGGSEGEVRVDVRLNSAE